MASNARPARELEVLISATRLRLRMHAHTVLSFIDILIHTQTHLCMCTYVCVFGIGRGA